MSTITATATWTKLRNGSWGVKGRGLAAGRSITVSKRSGERKSVTVERVIWTGADGTQIASVATDRATTTATRRPTGHRCEECGRGGAHWAHDLSGIGGYLCNTCDDGSASFC